MSARACGFESHLRDLIIIGVNVTLYFIKKVENKTTLYLDLYKWTWVENISMSCLSPKKNKIEKIHENNGGEIHSFIIK